MKPPFTIEPNVPIPGGTDSRVAKYPFSEMNIGDSFAFEHAKLTNIRNAAGAYAKRHNGVRFVFRQMGTDVWRCWKLEQS